MERDFMLDAGAYELPSNVSDQQVEVFEFYEHTPGEYTGFLGKLRPIYKDADNKTVKPDALGAVLNSFLMPIWIFQSLGTAELPLREVRITPEIALAFDPEKISVHSAYFNIYIPYLDQRSQWQNIQKFGKFTFPGNDGLRLVKIDPAMRTKKTVCFTNFPKYYGMPVTFSLTPGKKSVYIDTLTQGEVAQIVPATKILQLENQVDKIIEAEKTKRRASLGSYLPETPPQTNFDVLASEDTGEFSEA